jgi:predicted PurR-regulated permease PerM
VPGLGSGLVWIPAAIYLFVTGKIAAGIGLIVWGALVVGIADNLLRVYIVGRGAALPSFIVFVSTLGGLTTFGPAGILVGPVLVGVLIGVLDLYQAVLKSSGLSTAPDGSR